MIDGARGCGNSGEENSNSHGIGTRQHGTDRNVTRISRDQVAIACTCVQEERLGISRPTQCEDDKSIQETGLAARLKSGPSASEFSHL